MLALIDSLEEFITDHPIIILIVIILLRELYNLMWKHNSDKVSWRFPKTNSWGQFFWKLTIVIAIALFLGLCACLVIIPLFHVVGKLRSYLLDKAGHGDMQYHTIKIGQ